MSTHKLNHPVNAAHRVYCRVHGVTDMLYISDAD